MDFRRIAFIALLHGVVTTSALNAQSPAGDPSIPQLRRQGTAMQLVVDGTPFLVLGGELGNSSASSAEYLRSVWPVLRVMRLNTMLAPVYWERMEPREGQLDFALVDSLLAGARRNEMRLVLLWFGSWKNSMSTYAPEWVKTDPRRFPRARGSDGALDILSPFGAAARDADARAFAALMRHLREVDGRRHTVLMVQVENEIGMIPEPRDHAPAANAAWAGPVPPELMAWLRLDRATLAPEVHALWEAHGTRSSGSWAEVFGAGPEAEEVFMAWHFGRWVEHVTAAGKAEYPLPMFVNAALPRPDTPPGRYPSAGPLPHLIDVWRAAAPSIDLLAPDIYFPSFAEWAGRYTRPENPLFIPEATLNPQSAVNALYAMSAHDAIGFSPFSIENADSATVRALAQSYGLLRQLAPVVLAHQGRGTMVGVIPPVAFDGTVDESPREVRLGGYTLTVTFKDPWVRPVPGASVPPRGGLIVALGPDEYLVAGSGLVVTFAPTGPGDPVAGILSIQEGRYEDGRWVGGRWLNGDQSHQGRHLRIAPGQFEIQRVRLYRYR